MKIENEVKKPTLFRDLKPGDVFTGVHTDAVIFMKTVERYDTSKNVIIGHNAVDLENGNFEGFRDSCEVKKLNAKLVVKDEN